MRARTAGVLTLLIAAFAAPVLGGFAGTDLFIPMAGRGVGTYPSNWFTTVYLYNPNATAVAVDLTFLERNKDNVAASPPKVTDTLAPGETKVFENIVETTFGRTGTVYGAVRIQCTEKVVASTRVYSKESDSAPLTQSFGQDFAATPASFAIGLNESTDILGGYTTQPYQDSQARFNIGCVETTGVGSATVRWIARDASGQEQKHYDRTVPRLSQTQGFFHDYFTGVDLTTARISANVIAGSGRVICYGSLVTNDKTFPKPVQDPTTFEMVYPEEVLGTTTVQHDATLTGDGTPASLLGINDGGVAQAKLSATGGTAGQVLGTDGAALRWQDDGLGLPYGGEAASDAGVLVVTNTGAGQAVVGNSPAGLGVVGLSGAGTGVYGDGGGAGVRPRRPPRARVVGEAETADNAGVLGSNPDPAGWAGAFVGRVAITGDLACGGCVHGDDIADAQVTKGKLAATVGTAGQVLGTDGNGLQWQNDGLTLPFVGSGEGASPPFSGFTSAFAIEGTDWGTVGITGSGACTGVLGTTSGDIPGGLTCAGLAGHSNTRAGVSGTTNSTTPSGMGVRGLNSGYNTFGYLAGAYGAAGENGPFAGYLGYSDAGVFGKHATTDNQGHLARADKGVWGRAFNSGGIGVHGESSNGEGVYGSSGGASAGVHGFSGSKAGVWGESTSDAGILGTTTTGYAGYFIGRLLNTNLTGGGEHDVCADSTGVLVNCGTSDVRLKRDVVDLSSEIEVASALRQLRTVAYSWDTALERARNLGDRREIGLIAQEVEAVLPQVVSTGADGYKSVDYGKLTALLIEVAKAQQARIDSLEDRLAAIEAR